MKKNKTFLILCSAIFLIVAITYQFSLFSTLQNKFTDRFFLKRSPEAKIIIIAIDDISLAEIGQWPWPRSTFAKILPQLDNAKAVGIDINFSESSKLGIDDDKTLVKAFDESKTKVVLPVQLRSDDELSVKSLDMFTAHTEVGFVNVPVSSDNVVRHITNNRGDIKSFSAVLFGGNTPYNNRINYTGPAKNILTLSFIDVYNNKIPPSFFKDATVLIG
ncbi:CHASE2 domain-containing protein, partial [Candidatus Parcubacteria bacterium]|nr:CHASE2 domain-containing protein [Candidatus Parcubacteria bacterium]